jgi:DNA modification methylase
MSELPDDSAETLLWGHTGGPDNGEYTFNYELMNSKAFPEDHLNDEDKQVRTVWDIPNNKSKEELELGEHPTQKPLRVLERLILSASNEGELCLVPFAGSGSACVSAKLNDRDYLGYEVESEHVDLARTRLQQADEKPEQLQNKSSETQGTLDQYD